MPLKQLVGTRIRQFRSAAQLTQEELAYRIGKTPQAIGQIERGLAAPSFDTLEAISKVINTPIASMFPTTSSDHTTPKKDAVAASVMRFTDQLSTSDAEVLEIVAKALHDHRSRR